MGDKNGAISGSGELDSLADCWLQQDLDTQEVSEESGAPNLVETTRRSHFLQIKPLKAIAQQVLSPPMERGMGR